MRSSVNIICKLALHRNAKMPHATYKLLGCSTREWSWSRWGMRQSHLSCDKSSYYNGTWSTASSVCTMQLSLTRLGLLLSSLDTNSLPATDPGQKSLQQFQVIGCSHLAWIPISRPSQYCYCELGRRVFTDTLIKIINVLRHQIFPLINPKDY